MTGTRAALDMDARPDLERSPAPIEAGRAQVRVDLAGGRPGDAGLGLLKLADGRPYSFLLESVDGGAVRGRYSIIGIKPDLVWRCRGEPGRDQPARARRPAAPSSPAPSRRWPACAS